MNAKQWIAAYAERLGTEGPSAVEWGNILDLAGEAAHASERVAAPVACWVAARAGTAPEEALSVAKQVATDG
jgi:hypothetical protein